MGIKNLHPFLRKNCPEIYETVHLSEYAFKKVAIDTSLYLCKFKAICGDRWLSAFVNLVSCLRRNEIHCVFIYDTGCVKEKERERAERRAQQQKNKDKVEEWDDAYNEYELTGEVPTILVELHAKLVAKEEKDAEKSDFKDVKIKSFLRKSKGDEGNKVTDKINMKIVKERIEKSRGQILDISKEDFQLTKELFDILNIPWYEAPLEAETLCSHLVKIGLVDASISEDTDVLAYSCPTFLFKLDTSNDTCSRIFHKNILESLDMTDAQFLDLCIACGCDYNTNIPKVGSQTAFKLIKEHGCLDGVSKNTKLDVSILNHTRTRDIFINHPKPDIKNIRYCGSPDIKKLEIFMNKTGLNVNFENLIKCFTHNIVVIEEEEEEEETENKLDSDSENDYILED